MLGLGVNAQQRSFAYETYSFLTGILASCEALMVYFEVLFTGMRQFGLKES